MVVNRFENVLPTVIYASETEAWNRGCGNEWNSCETMRGVLEWGGGDWTSAEPTPDGSEVSAVDI